MVVLALCAAPAFADAGRPSLGVRVAKCQTGPDVSDRYAVFTASMPAIDGTARMEMRFELLQRRRHALGFARVALPKWGHWERSSQSDVPGFIFSKRIEQLAAPADYRALVRFRWLSADGKVLRNSRRTSLTCRQPDQRPDLTIGDVALMPDGTYSVGVTNAGRGDAGQFLVGVTVGSIMGTSEVTGLSAGESLSVPVTAPACQAGQLITVSVDSGEAVDEAHEGDNTAIRPCPTADRR